MAARAGASTQVWVGPRTWVEPIDDATHLASDMGVHPPKTWLPIDRDRAAELVSRLLGPTPDASLDCADFVDQFAPTARFLTIPTDAPTAVVGVDDATIGMICLAA